MVLIMSLGLFFLSFFCHEIAADSSLSKHVEYVLNTVPYILPAQSIIGKREWKELKLDELVTQLDRTTTSFGRWGLIQLLHPIADKKELEQRKKIIMFLVEHEDKMHLFQQQLKSIRDAEKHLLAYWDKHDELSRNARGFYYSVKGLKELNKSSLALNVSTIMELFIAWKYLIGVLAFGGISTEFKRWLYGKEDLNLMRGLKAGFKNPLKQHLPYLDQLKEHKSLGYTYKDYVKAFYYGSWGDRYTVLHEGFFVDRKKLGFLAGLFQKRDDTDFLRASMDPVSASICATIPTLFSDYELGNTIVSTMRELMSMKRTLDQLQNRVSDVAECINAIKKLQKMVNAKVPMVGTIFDQKEIYDNEREQFIKTLLTPRFLKKTGSLYSCGHVLTMNLEIQQMKKSIVPLLQSVALLDAYCAIATLYKESQNKRVVFSFAEFVDNQEPFLHYRDAWLPLLSPDRAVTNDFILGGDNPGKIIITGPNGGGKSTILKTLGMAVLAQSWCIGPFREGKQTLFSSIKTGLATSENLSQELSTGMAEMKVMQELLIEIGLSDSKNHMLVLIDEPYRGIVDTQAARRIYQFGKNIANYSHSLVAIATHNKKPIFLEQDTDGIFANYQVKIEETKLGVFKRLFKLEQGPATWWFEDDEKSSRFIDWINILCSFKGNVISAC